MDIDFRGYFKGRHPQNRSVKREKAWIRSKIEQGVKAVVSARKHGISPTQTIREIELTFGYSEIGRIVAWNVKNRYWEQRAFLLCGERSK